MSSEESGDEGITLIKRPLPWLKAKYSNSLHFLDQLYFERLSRKSKGMVRQRENGEPSERPAPSNPLSYAVIADENMEDLGNTTLDSTIDHD